jgi:hypothetical protein
MEIAIAYAFSNRRRGLDVGLELKSPDLVTGPIAYPLDVLQEDIKTAHDCVQKALKIPVVPHKEAPAVGRKQKKGMVLPAGRSPRWTGYADTYIEPRM